MLKSIDVRHIQNQRTYLKFSPVAQLSILKVRSDA